MCACVRTHIYIYICIERGRYIYIYIYIYLSLSLYICINMYVHRMFSNFGVGGLAGAVLQVPHILYPSSMPQPCSLHPAHEMEPCIRISYPSLGF